MMMRTNVQLLCEDLDQLLKDICDYLNTQTNDENMTQSQRLFANKLIQRSKKQLQQISKVSMALSTDVDDQNYVDMSKQSATEVISEEDVDNEYSPVVCPSMTSTEDICPFELLPATEIEKCEKYGHLDRKGRFLFIGHQKKLFAGIKANWFLLYTGRKDNKPIEVLNLNNFIAKPVDSMKTKVFELRCVRTQKAFQFVAQTPKDMVQWVACINRRSVIKEDNEEIPTEDDGNDEDKIHEKQKIIEEPLDTLKKKTKPLPPLPKAPENTYVLSHPIPEVPSVEHGRDDSQLPTEDDPDDDDQIYDVIEDLKANKSAKPKNTERNNPINKVVERPQLNDRFTTDSSFTNSFTDDDEQEIYDIIQEVIVDKSTKPNDTEIPKPINKVIQRPQLDEISRTDSSVTNSFTDDDEDDIYDMIEQRPPDKFTTSALTRQIDLEPEEEYCNLVQNPKSKSPVLQNISDGDGEYLNIRLNTKGPQIPNTRKVNVPTIASVSITVAKVDEPEEEYSNLVAIAKTTNKPLLPKPPLKSVINIQQEQRDSIADDEDVEEEYDCVVPQPKKSPTSNVQLRIMEVNKHTNMTMNKGQKLQDSRTNDEEVEEEYDCLVSQPKNTPKSNIQLKITGLAKHNVKSEEKHGEDAGEEYDCVVSQPMTNVQAKIREVSKNIRMNQARNQSEKMKREPPALKPKPKVWRNK